MSVVGSLFCSLSNLILTQNLQTGRFEEGDPTTGYRYTGLLSLRNNRFTFKTVGKSLIVLEESMDDIYFKLMKGIYCKASTHKQLELETLSTPTDLPKMISPDTAPKQLIQTT